MITLTDLLDESELRRLDDVNKMGIIADVKEKDVLQLTWRELASLFSVISFPFQKVPNSTTAALVIEELTDRSIQKKIDLFGKRETPNAHRKHCINCQILGMQKSVDRLLDFDFIEDGLKDEIATKLVGDLNDFIEQHHAFDEDAEHKLELHLADGKNFSTKLVPRV